MKLKQLYNKYKNHIVCVLICLFFINQCQLNMSERRCVYSISKIQTELDSVKINNNISLDSLNNIIRNREDSINILNIKLNALINNNELLKNNNSILLNNNEYYQKTNKVLIQTNKEIINKDNK